MARARCAVTHANRCATPVMETELDEAAADDDEDEGKDEDEDEDAVASVGADSDSSSSTSSGRMGSSVDAW